MLVNHLAKRHPDISLDSVPELNLPILRATKDYYCQYCDKVYKSSSKRKAHILKNHPGAALPISNRKQGAYPEVAGVPNPSFSQTVGSVTTSPQNCNWCHKQYASKAKLLQHQRKEHVEYLDQHLSEDNANDKTIASPKRSREDILEDVRTYNKISEYAAITEKVLTANIMDEFVDDPEPDSHYCHLSSISESDMFQSTESLNPPNSHLYRLLTNANNMAPPR
ncbi:hypothetical protein HHI36_008010 [Cryptolaemus montrouzieri]|uniref:C2H2-type domain-containing protein n=1 Tax=Cryptolaemus montrouzieri TaxID=559131 RepID=A0ABD2MRA7_9CUCU